MAGRSMMMAHEQLQIADEKALVLVGRPQTSSLAKRA